MLSIGTPLSPSATRMLLCGSGELGKEVAIELQRFGVEVIAVDRYPNAPAMQVAHRSHVIDMTDPRALRKVIEKEKPHLVVPEIEAIATEALIELEKEGYKVIPTARAANLTMNRMGIRTLAAEELKLPCSPYHFAGTFEEFKAAVGEIGFPCVVKPIMSSSGKGQSLVRSEAEVESAWTYSQEGSRTGAGKVIVEGFIDFDYEITLLTVRHSASRLDFRSLPPGSQAHSTERGTRPHDGIGQVSPLDPLRMDSTPPPSRGREVWSGRLAEDAVLDNQSAYVGLQSGRQKGEGEQEILNTTSFCEPIGHRQVDGDYVESWQPHPMPAATLEKAKEIAKAVTDNLGGWGLFGVELFVKNPDQVWFSEVSPRPHDTGLVTLISQDLSEFALHARAILGLPIPVIRQFGPSASAALLVHGSSSNVVFVGLDGALAEPDTALRLFGKPEVRGHRRMGVGLAKGKDVEEAREKARGVVAAIKVSLEP